MIQRIQTVYLTAVLVSCVLMFTFPFAKFISPDQGTYIMSVIGVKYLAMTNQSIFVNFWFTFPMLVIVIASAILTVISILLYQKRKMQVLLVNITFLLHAILIILVFLVYAGHFEKLSKVLPTYQFGIAFPLISLVLLVLASRSIRKDEALVKSADRLR